MNQLKTAFWMVLLTVLLVLIGRVWLGNSGMYLFLGIAIVMNGTANPLSGQTFANLFSTHPPLEERIRRLEVMAAGIRR